MFIDSPFYSKDEVDAALCLWEECLQRLFLARTEAKRNHQDWTEAQEAEPLWNWLRGGEGAANAREMCIYLCKDIEYSYQVARDELGFDDSFDWEFVPRWADVAMEVTETQLLTPKWAHYIAYKVTEAWKHDTCRSF